MIVLSLFSFVSGVVTILSPCILPILPIILSSTVGGQNTGKSRPVGIVFGFILSFTFFTLFLSTLVRLTGISSQALRTISVFIIASFGISLLVPYIQTEMEKFFSQLSSHLPRGNAQPGFLPGIMIGLSLGLLWTPCVGPILASVISLAVSGSVTLDTFIITLAYSFGTALPMFLILIGGQNLLRKVPLLLMNTAKIQKVFGFVMIITAIGIHFQIDRAVQTNFLKTFPRYGIGLTKVEDNELVKSQLKIVGNKKIVSLLPSAPELVPGGAWFNSKPLTIQRLRGKVVVVDFWTYTCINCQRTLPYLRNWWEKYKDKGLMIVGVHSPEFEFEKERVNVSRAIVDFGLAYPIMQDNDFATWRAFDNHYWPAKYIIDKDGAIRYTHFGEGGYDETERVIQELLKESGGKDIPTDISNPTSHTYGWTPETYLGFNRIDRFSSPESIQKNITTSYSNPSSLSNDTFAFKGKWTISPEYATPEKGSELLFNFNAKEVFLVMKITKGKSSSMKVYLDNKMQSFGADNNKGTVTVNDDKLYRLILLPNPGRHMLRLEFQDENAQLFAFTFG